MLYQDDRNLCTFWLQVCGREFWKKVDVEEWVNQRVSAKPLGSNQFVNGLYKAVVPRSEKLIKVAAFSDLHIDYNYTAGTNANCGRLICCRDGKPDSSENTAGKWGHENCDLPEKTMLNMFDFIDGSI